jgi:putative ATP-binding cassette transporter
MNDSLDDEAGAESEVEEGSHANLGRQLLLMWQVFRFSPVRRPLLTLIAVIVAVVGATAYGQIRLNSWNKPFFDALSRRDFSDFILQLEVFGLIVGGLLVLNVAQKWLVETLKLRLREGLVRDLVGHWMQPRRAFWLAHAGAIGVNPDQRMHEDARKLCELSADLGVGLLQSSILFMTFAGVLWVLSADFRFHINGADYAVPGFMLWAAILYAGLGSLMSWWVGRSLVKRNAGRYAREADLRFSLVRINEHLDGISLASGEADEMRRVERDLGGVLAATRRLVKGLTRLTWVTAGFGWMTLVAPILVAVPLYFTGKISFGGLMMAAAAFTQAQSSLRWFVDNFSTIADWRATLLRVATFREALTMGEEAITTEGRIAHSEGEAGTLIMRNLEIESSAGRDRLKEKDVIVKSGERVLIACAPGTGKTPLFRALAGLWPWGSGEIVVPRGELFLHVPRGTVYLPRGTLREVLAYPVETSRFSDPSYSHALDRAGLGRLRPMLDEMRRWDRELSQEEQQNLTFARIVLQAPQWVLIDDAFGSLEDAAIERIIEVLGRELKDTGIIHIGRSVEGHEPIFSRVLHLVRMEGIPGVEHEPMDSLAPDDGSPAPS